MYLQSTTHTIYVPKIMHILQTNLRRAEESKWFETRDLGTTARRRWGGPRLRALRWNLCDIWIHLTGGRRGVSAPLYQGEPLCRIWIIGKSMGNADNLPIDQLSLPNARLLTWPSPRSGRCWRPWVSACPGCPGSWCSCCRSRCRPHRGSVSGAAAASAGSGPAAARSSGQSSSWAGSCSRSPAPHTQCHCRPPCPRVWTSEIIQIRRGQHLTFQWKLAILHT